MAFLRQVLKGFQSSGSPHLRVIATNLWRASSTAEGVRTEGQTSGATFESKVSIRQLYPNSKPNVADNPVEVPKLSAKQFRGVIPLEKISLTYLPSQGSGTLQQTMSKANTKVELRFHVASADWLDKGVRETFVKLHGHRIDKDGNYVLHSDLTRSQLLNRADVLDRLREALRAAHGSARRVEEAEEETQRKRIERAARERLREKRESSPQETKKQ